MEKKLSHPFKNSPYTGGFLITIWENILWFNDELRQASEKDFV